MEHKQKNNTNDLSIEISIPTKGTDSKKLWINCEEPSMGNVFVILRNTGKDSISLFEEWNSRGYFAISFEFKDDKGKITTIKKALRDWTKNFPSYFLLLPGETMVLEENMNKTILITQVA